MASGEPGAVLPDMNQGGQNTEEVKGLGPELTGRAVAEAAASDFSQFFLRWCPYEVRVSFGPVHTAKVRKDGKGSYIVIPNDMAQGVITTPERLLFHLLMIGHEIAHLVHRHLDDASEQSADIIAAWNSGPTSTARRSLWPC